MTASPPPPLYGASPEEEPAPALDPEVVGDDEALAEAVDAFIERSPEARAGQWEIALLHECLRGVVDAEAWNLVLRVDEAATARLADVTVLVARWAFAEGQRHPLPTTEVSP